MTFRSTVLVLALVLSVAASAVAQIPTVQVFTDPALQEPFYRCGTLNTTAELFVVVTGADFVVSAVDFHIEYPPSVTWLADFAPDANYFQNEWVTIGNSPTGIAIAWANCCMTDGSEGPFVVMRALVHWSGPCTCTPFVVGGYEPLGKTQPTLVRNGDFTEFDAAGLATYYNPAICDLAVEQSTWGKVKSLYR